MYDINYDGALNNASRAEIKESQARDADLQKQITQLCFAVSDLNARLTALESKIICPRHSGKKSNEVWC